MGAHELTLGGEPPQVATERVDRDTELGGERADLQYAVASEAVEQGGVTGSGQHG
jgi:hypothetical protein